MVIGSYDKAKKFHPMALMITMHETGEDFKFFFSAINQHRPLFKPTTLIADAAAAITNGFQAVWSLIHRVTCGRTLWFVQAPTVKQSPTLPIMSAKNFMMLIILYLFLRFFLIILKACILLKL
jgi:hypothetical protein